MRRIQSRAVVVGLLAGASAGAAHAGFVDASRTHLPLAPTGGNTMDAEIADLNADGHLDVVLAVEFGANCVLFGSDEGLRYDANAFPGGFVHDSEDIAIADFDGDGDPDIVFVAEDDQTNELYLNDGKGHFEAAHDRVDVGGTSNAVVAHDVDDDGDIDLVIGNAGANKLLLNDGSGHFKAAPSEQFPVDERTTQDLEFGDIDGDGDLDLLVANEDGNRLLECVGKGRFEDVTDGRLPMREALEETREGDFGDIDGDGDLDIIFANVGWREGDPQNRLLINDGTGTFTDETSTHYPTDGATTIDADFVDIDADGDLDLVQVTFQPGVLQVLTNDGSGVFTLDADAGFSTPGWLYRGVDVEVVDLDGDGALDAYLTNHATCDFLLRGSGEPGA